MNSTGWVALLNGRFCGFSVKEMLVRLKAVLKTARGAGVCEAWITSREEDSARSKAWEAWNLPE